MRCFIHILLLVLGIFAYPVQAKDVFLRQMTTEQLREVYQFYGYDGVRGFLMLPTYHYPQIYLEKLPSDFAKIDDDQRAVLFIKILAPLGMKINEEIGKERQKLVVVQEAFHKNNELSKEQVAYVEALAKEYDVFTRLQGYQRYKFLLSELLVRVDEVPVSLLIGVAAIETDWGKNRLATEGNALYRQLVWNSTEGMKPQDETEDDDYRIKSYPSLYAAMNDFVHKMNSHVNFDHMRDFRRLQRESGSIVGGTWFAPKLLTNSPLKNYAGLLEYTVAFYELVVIDKSLLGSELTEKPFPERWAKLLTKKMN